jgi:hypothetical protein
MDNEMNKFFELLVNLSDAGIEVVIRKNRDVPCAFFLSGFYRSDGDAYVFLHKEQLVLSTRFSGDMVIQSLYDIVYESHAQWKISRSLDSKWKHQSSQWVPLYQRLKLYPFDIDRGKYMTAWIGVDLDGTLAEFDEWRGVHHIGKPVPRMLNLVKTWLEQGIEVRIFTARATDPNATRYINDWVYTHLGQELPVTNIKDYDCIAIVDDRAVRVMPNTGRPCCTTPQQFQVTNIMTTM